MKTTRQSHKSKDDSNKKRVARKDHDREVRQAERQRCVEILRNEAKEYAQGNPSLADALEYAARVLE